MKIKIILSILCGGLLGFIAFLISGFFVPEDAFVIALVVGILSAVLVLPVLLYDEKKTKKKYVQLEKEISTAILYKAQGNFSFDKTVRSGNIYFCEDSIVVVSFEEEPFVVEKVELPLISKCRFDNFHVEIYTRDDRKILISTTQAPEILAVLKDKGWSLQKS